MAIVTIGDIKVEMAVKKKTAPISSPLPLIANWKFSVPTKTSFICCRVQFVPVKRNGIFYDDRFLSFLEIILRLKNFTIGVKIGLKT